MTPWLLTACVLLATQTNAGAVAPSTPVQKGPLTDPLPAAVTDAHRPLPDRARDAYRHPVETLRFFGIEATMTVVELWPEGGYYTRILAPLLKDRGSLYLASAASPPGAYDRAARRRHDALSQPDVWGHPRFTVLDRGRYAIAPAGSADVVLTFRNIHNWMAAGYADDVFGAAFKALKPGGVLAIEEHRAPPTV